MNKETLHDLVEVHNILYRFPVWGENVIPFAQALATLQNVIQEMDFEIRGHCDDTTTDKETV